jgi:hypothetical protein
MNNDLRINHTALQFYTWRVLTDLTVLRDGRLVLHPDGRMAEGITYGEWVLFAAKLRETALVLADACT